MVAQFREQSTAQKVPNLARVFDAIEADRDALAQAEADAGANIMAHHRPGYISEGGWNGFGQILDQYTSVSANKFKAGEYLQRARRNRLRGWQYRNLLAKAAAFRRTAYKLHRAGEAA